MPNIRDHYGENILDHNGAIITDDGVTDVSTFTPVLNGATITESPAGTFTRTAGGGWNSAWMVSSEAYGDYATFEFKIPNPAAGELVVGFSDVANPSAVGNMRWTFYAGSLDYANRMGLFVNGGFAGLPSYVLGDKLRIERDRTNIIFYVEGIERARYTDAGTGPVYFAFMPNTNGTSIEGVALNPSSLPTSAGLAPANGTHARITTSPTLAAKSAIAPANGAHARTTTSPTLAAKSAIAPANGVHARTTTSPTLTAKSAVAPHNGAHSRITTEPIITFAGISVQPASGQHARTTTSSSLAAKSVITPHDIVRGRTTGTPILLAKSSLFPANGLHTHTATSPSLSAKSQILPNNGLHGHSATSPALTLLPVAIYPHNLSRGSAAPPAAGGVRVTAFFFRP